MDWMETNFYIPETRNDPVLRGRLKLQPYQADVLREALAKDEKGNFRYSIIVWSDIKKSIKSTIAAAVNLFRAEYTEWGEFYIIANDLKQADSRVAHYLRRCLQLNPKLGSKYSQRGYRTTGPNGSFLEAIPIDPSGEAGSNADGITYCMDEQTQILTRDGWKGWEALTLEDEIATRSPDGLFEWQKPLDIYCAPYDGDMVRITHRSLDVLVTPDHRMYGKFTGGRGIAPGVDGKWKREFVESLPIRFLEAKYAMQTRNYYPVLTSTWDGGVPAWLTIPPTVGVPSGKILQEERIISPMDYAEFMGWFLSEGCVIKKKGRFDGFSIGQSKTRNPQKREQILALLRRMGFVPHEWAGGMNIVVYHSAFGEMLSRFGLSNEKYVPDDIKNMPLPELKMFLKTFIDGDGAKNWANGYVIAVRSEQLRDDLVEISQKCGYSCSSHETVDRRWPKNPVMYAVYLRSQDDGRRTTKVKHRNWSLEKYKGMVFCPSVPNGTIYARRNGRYYWTGNSELWGANEKEKQRMWCLDDESEILTNKGWKKGVDLTVLDEVAVYDNGYIKWEHPRDVFIQPYSGKMHLYQHKNFSLMCTNEHRLFGRYSYSGMREGRNKYDHYGVMRSNELRNSGYSYYHPVLVPKGIEKSTDHPNWIRIAPTKFHEEKFISWKDWVTFLGLYLTEGCTNDFRGVPCNVKISQLRAPHPQKYDRIYDILHGIFGDWVKIEKRDGFKISNTELAKITKPLGTTWFKRVPRAVMESDLETLRSFMDAYILGDGHIVEESGSVQITCASKGMADDLQEIALRLGIRSSVRRHRTWWRITLLSGSFSVSVHKDSWSEINYSGKVWCPIVSTGLFMARREGRPFITGNSEATLSPTKRGKSFRWVESYAGFTEESKLLYSLYDLGVKQGELLWPDRLYEVTEGTPTPLELYVNREAGMLCLWNTQPRCPWQTKDYYREEAKILLPAEFQRMHRNQWVTSEDTFVPMEWFDACFRRPEEWPEVDVKRHPMVIALDAAVSNDNFGLLVGCRHPQFENDVMVWYAKAWKPGSSGVIDFQGTEENPGPERMVRKLVKDYNIVQIAYDPYQLHDMAMRMKREGIAWIKPFNQGSERLIADSQLRDVIRDRRLWHRGEPELRDQVQNANAKLDEQDSKIRIVKRVERLKIDLAVCLSMCTHELLRLNL